MDSRLFFALCAALSLFSCARAAPVHQKVNFTKCKKLSILLNEMARNLYNRVESPNMTVIVHDPPVSIRPADSCDPWSLQTNNETCQSRIIVALRNYSRIFHKDGVFANSACSTWRKQASEVAEVTQNLLRLLKHPVESVPFNTVQWHHSALCRDSVERLFSFSVVSARVFSFLSSPTAPILESKRCRTGTK